MVDQINIFWFRRDLRLHDNHGLFKALKSGLPVLPLFIFDKDILDDLEDKNDRRINFIYQEIKNLKTELEKHGSSLLVEYGNPYDTFINLLKQYNIAKIYVNEDYEPYAIKRDQDINDLLFKENIEFRSYKDQVIFAKNDILKADQSPYTIFTPYSKKWKEKLHSIELMSYTNEKYFNSLYKTDKLSLLSLEEIGFEEVHYQFPGKILRPGIIHSYHNTRDFPAQNGTSKLSVHMRFGTISIRKLVKEVLKKNETYLNELIWREFYMMIIYHFPYVVTQSFKKKYDQISWINNETDFENWKNGSTGIPLVDAGMRELNSTGYMHNRVRMIVSSFLTKNLLIDWRWGEQYFAQKLLDYELSSNNGGWQWAAGSGCDAAPYFRVFNPEMQQKKFDPELKYVKKWIPELESSSYRKPIVDLKKTRERALKVYKSALN